MTSTTQEAETDSEPFAIKLAKAGYSDFYVLSREAAAEILTEKRLELLDYLNNHEVESIRDLARQLERDKRNVSDDLDILWENDLIEYEEDGSKKQPYPTSKNIFIKPVLEE